MQELKLDPEQTALVLIDLQNGIAGRETAPHAAMDVVKRGAELAAVFRQKDGVVVYVRVDLANLVTLPVDEPSRDPKAPPPPANASELVPEAGRQAGDVLITKNFWDAFHGTELEKILRLRGVTTIVLGGIATNFGVESTVRSAASLGFAVVLAEDVMTSRSVELHSFAVKNIFPRLGRVRQSEEIVAAING